MVVRLPILIGPGACGGETDDRAAAIATGMPTRDAAADSPAPAELSHLIDSRGRVIRDLRLSITDRCNFRCVYCMEPDVRFFDPADVLSVEEIVRLARVCIDLGVQKVRLTGGEPTVHPRLTEIIAGITALGPRDLAMTTNGSLCTPAKLAAWRDAGLRRITFSIDSLRPERFARLTRSTSTPSEVMRTIADALAAGYRRVKVNAVVVRGFNDDEVPDLAGIARDLPVQMRFIEYMPLDSGHAWDRSLLVTAEEILGAIRSRWSLTDAGMGDGDESSTARVYRFDDHAGAGDVGIIAPVTRPFCGACSRLRITADGKVRPCLFSLRESDLLGPMRAGESDRQLARRLIDAAWSKQAGHGISSDGFVQPDRPMSAIGG